MTRLIILASTEQRRFDAPPKFTNDDRALHFALSNDEMRLIQELRTPANKVGFVLQLGYFKANARFFSAEQFRHQDIDYVANMLGITPAHVDLSSYQKKIPIDHRKRILTFLNWQSFDKVQQKKVVEYANWLVQQQLSPRNIFLSIIDFCWQNKIELPSYSTLAIYITDAYNHFESKLINIVTNKLTQYQREKLNLFTGINVEKKQMQRSPLTLIKQINQSLRPMDIQANVEAFSLFKDYFNEFKSIIHELQLSDSATEYFATWVQKSTLFQLNQFPNENKLYLHLLCYIKHQFYQRHDVLVDIFLKSTRAAINSANDELNQLEKSNRSERNKAIKKLSAANKNSRELIERITEIVKSPTLPNNLKLEQIEDLVDQYNTQHDVSEKNKLVELEQSLDKISNSQTFFDALESMSLKLQRRVSTIVKVIEFNAETSDLKLLDAINYFKLNNGEVSHKSPFEFLETHEKEAIFSEDKLRVPLYKILLFIHVADAIKSGRLNLSYSYRYKAIHEYLIDESLWKSQRETLLSRAGLLNSIDFHTVISSLKQQLEQKYQIVNQHFLNGKNPHLAIDNNTGKVKVSTPKTDSDESEYISSILCKAGFVPILQILSDVNRITQFTTSFKHFSIKHKKMNPQSETIFAGILGKGCNIGVNRIANISKGISVDVLKNTVNWCFNMKNLQDANNKILNILNKLFLSNNYRHTTDQLHTGSDGRKVNVAVDSLTASYSYKYFGKGKGVTVYTFLDERQLLFHALVMSASEREAAYVIDGLLQNEVIKSNIHSTDTHGFTETIFSATHFIDTAFAPRFKDIGDQTIYVFSAKQTYENRDYKILPSRLINIKLIEKHWDDILRFMATIKLKHTTASQLFKRLSSYAKDHPLYQAIKEFGRIIKSIFILTYFDDVELRQRIEKQLNKVELSNKFSKAVFFANNQEFKHGTKEEQEIATACMVLIQNAILLWNYLYMSQILVNNADIKERIQIINSIGRGSMMSWGHINLQGEYDFTRPATNEVPFDMEKILALKAV